MNERIKILRQQLRLSQSQFAFKLNMSVSGISNIESARNEPSHKTIMDMVDTFNVNEHWLRTGEGEIFNVGGPTTPGANSVVQGGQSVATFAGFQNIVNDLVEKMKKMYEAENERLKLENERLWKLIANSELGKLRASENYPMAA